MKRLRDIEQPSALEAKAQALVDAVEPLSASQSRMMRVRQRLDAPRRAPLLRRLPALAIAGLVATFGASAFAAVRLYVASVAPQSEAVEIDAPAPAPTAPKRVHKGEREPREADTREVEVEPRVRPRMRAKAQSTPQAELAADSELIHRAVKALRRDNNPALAARLLEADRARAAKGPLAEEALSLRIEAAVALDNDAAPRLAREYLSRYPNGRYKGIAQRALRGREVAGE
jgi:hypothetical protein